MVSDDEIDSLRDTYTARVEELDARMGEFLDRLREVVAHGDGPRAVGRERLQTHGQHLTQQRSNGLRAMVERIRSDAREALAAAS